MKLIMAPVANRPECKIALDQAFRLADELASNIIGCHLRPHRLEALPARRPHYDLRFGRKSKSSEMPTEKEVDLRCRAAQALFSRRIREHNFQLLKRPRLGIERGAQWVEMVGDFDRLFSIVGPVTDMSVVSRPKQRARGSSPEFLLAALLHSGKPVLVLPQTPVPSVGKRVLVAWNQSVEAARAVSAALPLLTRAESVHICSCGPENQPGPKSTNLAQYLTYWGVKCTRISTKAWDIPKEIEEAYKKTESDLIVMGAYSRSRMREIVFGGVTQYMLFETTRPVFALHS